MRYLVGLENITLGCDANWNYCPNDPVTRAQMGSFLGRFLDVLGNGGVLGAVSGFDDVPDGNVHAARIRQIADAGITLGCNPAGTLYCPDDPVTRAQMATFIARALGLAPEPDNRFSDVVTGSTHAGNINNRPNRSSDMSTSLGPVAPVWHVPTSRESSALTTTRSS